MQLYIGNKNYSSWSMRPWVLMKQAGIPFEEVMVPFDDAPDPSPFKVAVARVSPVGRVPVLVHDGLSIWDSLAIAETLAETFPDRALWPAQWRARARARSVCAEMHAGFGAIRTHLSMNIEAELPEVGARLLAEHPPLRADIARLVDMWAELLEQHGGPLLFGDFSVADAFFAPVVTRLRTYAIAVPEPIGAYCDRVVALPGVAAWIDGALAEKNFLQFEEAYRTHR